MESVVVGNQMNVINNQSVNTYNNSIERSNKFIEKNPIFKILTAEGCESFYNYIERLGLENDPNPLFLSSQHYYYYDAEEMKNVNTIINLKELNHIKDLKSFLHSIFHILSPNTNFIGCFVDNKKVNGYMLKGNMSVSRINQSNEDIENGIVSRYPLINMLYSFMDSKTNKHMSGSSVSMLLENHGFKVLDMTVINGLTYFHARKSRATEN